MSSAEEKAALIQGPVAAADTSGRTGVARISISGSAQSAALPTAMLSGGFVALWCSTDIQWAFGVGSAPTIALNALGALGVGGATIGITLSAATREHWPVPRGATHIGWIGTTGYLEIVNTQALAG